MFPHLALALAFAIPSSAAPVRDAHLSIIIDDRPRTYLLHIPSVSPDKPLPLVIVLHGGGQSGKGAERFTGFNALADREGFIVAYPDAIAQRWNDGRETTKAAKKGVDDVRFIRELIAQISKEHNVDPHRIYATGPSNGGFMTHRLACDLSDVLAAAGPVIAGFPLDYRDSCRPAKPISIIMIQGTADKLVPFNGGQVGGKGHWGAGGKTDSAENTRAFWAEREDCKAPPEAADLPDEANDGTKVRKYAYTGCQSGVEVVQYVVEGMGHRWPTKHAPLRRRGVVTWMLGPTSTNIDASEVTWKFFESHPKP